MAVCECLKITYKTFGGTSTVIEVNNAGQYNGFFYYEFTDPTTATTYTIYFDSQNWQISTGGIFGTPTGCAIKNFPFCPIAEDPVWTPNGTFEHMKTEYCNTIPCCIRIKYNDGEEHIVQISTPTGISNGTNYWSFGLAGYPYTFYLFLFTNGEGCKWQVFATKIGAPLGSGFLWAEQTLDPTYNCGDCPRGEFTTYQDEWTQLLIEDCNPDCIQIEDRIKKQYNAIQFPIVTEEQNRGWFKCCDPMLVLAGNGTESWKNDVTSAWIKLSDPTDSVTFSLTKDGQPTIYNPTPVAFLNEADAYYATVQWLDVLNLDGEGCYTLNVDYNISGVISSFIWGVYKLKTYTIENALQTARIRVFFNLQQSIEGINFTGSNVEDSIRFYGFIGERQPNMEIDNLIYNNREMKTVVRENLNTYQITTDPTTDDTTRRLTNLYLLSENEMFISDYNAHNHSYLILDLPVIVQESPEIEYIDILQRKAIVKCLVGDKFKNSRTFY